MCFQCAMMGFGGHPLFGDYDNYSPWLLAAEKSRAAIEREEVAMAKFNEVKNSLENTLLDNTKVIIASGMRPDSESPLKMIPTSLISHILSFAQGEQKKTKDEDINNNSNNQAAAPAAAAAAVAVAAAPSATSTIASYNMYRPKKQKVDEDIEVDLTDMSLYKPGNKIIIPLTPPSCHLTGPCWRDFSRAVRQHDGWDVRRIAATPEEKKEYKETRKSTVYFINAVFTVPGKKKRVAKKRKTEDADSKPPAKKVKKANKQNSAKH